MDGEAVDDEEPDRKKCKLTRTAKVQAGDKVKKLREDIADTEENCGNLTDSSGDEYRPRGDLHVDGEKCENSQIETAPSAGESVRFDDRNVGSRAGAFPERQKSGRKPKGYAKKTQEEINERRRERRREVRAFKSQVCNLAASSVVNLRTTSAHKTPEKLVEVLARKETLIAVPNVCVTLESTDVDAEGGSTVRSPRVASQIIPTKLLLGNTRQAVIATAIDDACTAAATADSESHETLDVSRGAEPAGSSEVEDESEGSSEDDLGETVARSSSVPSKEEGGRKVNRDFKLRSTFSEDAKWIYDHCTRSIASCMQMAYYTEKLHRMIEAGKPKAKVCRPPPAKGIKKTKRRQHKCVIKGCKGEAANMNRHYETIHGIEKNDIPELTECIEKLSVAHGRDGPSYPMSKAEFQAYSTEFSDFREKLRERVREGIDAAVTARSASSHIGGELDNAFTKANFENTLLDTNDLLGKIVDTAELEEQLSVPNTIKRVRKALVASTQEQMQGTSVKGPYGSNTVCAILEKQGNRVESNKKIREIFECRYNDCGQIVCAIREHVKNVHKITVKEDVDFWVQKAKRSIGLMNRKCIKGKKVNKCIDKILFSTQNRDDANSDEEFVDPNDQDNIEQFVENLKDATPDDRHVLRKKRSTLYIKKGQKLIRQAEYQNKCPTFCKVMDDFGAYVKSLLNSSKLLIERATNQVCNVVVVYKESKSDGGDTSLSFIHKNWKEIITTYIKSVQYVYRPNTIGQHLTSLDHFVDFMETFKMSEFSAENMKKYAHSMLVKSGKSKEVANLFESAQESKEKNRTPLSDLASFLDSPKVKEFMCKVCRYKELFDNGNANKASGIGETFVPNKLSACKLRNILITLGCIRSARRSMEFKTFKMIEASKPSWGQETNSIVFEVREHKTQGQKCYIVYSPSEFITFTAYMKYYRPVLTCDSSHNAVVFPSILHLKDRDLPTKEAIPLNLSTVGAIVDKMFTFAGVVKSKRISPRSIRHSASSGVRDSDCAQIEKDAAIKVMCHAPATAERFYSVGSQVRTAERGSIAIIKSIYGGRDAEVRQREFHEKMRIEMVNCAPFTFEGSSGDARLSVTLAQAYIAFDDMVGSGFVSDPDVVKDINLNEKLIATPRKLLERTVTSQELEKIQEEDEQNECDNRGAIVVPSASERVEIETNSSSSNVMLHSKSSSVIADDLSLRDPVCSQLPTVSDKERVGNKTECYPNPLAAIGSDVTELHLEREIFSPEIPLMICSTPKVPTRDGVDCEKYLEQYYVSDDDALLSSCTLGPGVESSMDSMLNASMELYNIREREAREAHVPDTDVLETARIVAAPDMTITDKTVMGMSVSFTNDSADDEIDDNILSDISSLLDKHHSQSEKQEPSAGRCVPPTDEVEISIAGDAAMSSSQPPKKLQACQSLGSAFISSMQSSIDSEETITPFSSFHAIEGIAVLDNLLPENSVAPTGDLDITIAAAPPAWSGSQSEQVLEEVQTLGLALPTVQSVGDPVLSFASAEDFSGFLGGDEAVGSDEAATLKLQKIISEEQCCATSSTRMPPPSDSLISSQRISKKMPLIMPGAENDLGSLDVSGSDSDDSNISCVSTSFEGDVSSFDLAEYSKLFLCKSMAEAPSVSTQAVNTPVYFTRGQGIDHQDSKDRRLRAKYRKILGNDIYERMILWVPDHIPGYLNKYGRLMINRDKRIKLKFLEQALPPDLKHKINDIKKFIDLQIANQIYKDYMPLNMEKKKRV